jgi:hypothetical protein
VISFAIEMRDTEADLASNGLEIAPFCISGLSFPDLFS